ncbi:MAG TPA: HPr(Ser) kinase/phosphatase [Polyangiaceae bacterium]|jgi:HPr kinase/phosphorylase|nr:HPr(Ser) kinase/phosphatase [Polyangiaceae bacterium]
MSDAPSTAPQHISVRELLEDTALGLKVHLVAGGAGLDRKVHHVRIQKSGLALVGHLHGVVPTRVQILGGTELSYLEGLRPAEQASAVAALLSLELSCVVVTRGVEPPPALIAAAQRTDTPLLVCTERSSVAIGRLHALLDERLAPRTRIHGVLVDVFEVGVLLLGKSGIGKSECALDLVMRGHRLVADDAIECDYRPPGMVFGQPAALLRYHIEVRGLGILNIKDLFGVTAIRERKRLDLVVELKEEQQEFDRLGLEDETRDLLGVTIRKVTLPVRPGRNMSSIIEIAARNELLRQAGHHPARDLVQRLEQSLEVGHAAPTHQLNRPPSSQFRAVTAPMNESSAPPPVTPRRS